ncbi:MAG: response regulator transcription factor [Chloroflexi bacterium]|nr:response regulator transcription factor [Chloroflexota bacterium]MCI0576689.1 response regulator transcription factor [Chloroflexota bacterium]MCI0646853.1 response regulator transcription factor [Chloroflexota bacterium]MCI0731827.1 response regulator transcription factor [Chloroflexota bacterium]
MTIRALIADDNTPLRQVMHWFIDKAEEFVVVGAIRTVAETLELIQSLQPDVVILDDYLPPVPAAAAIPQIRALGLPVRILVASMEPDARLARQVMEAGADGFILKTEFADHLIPAIRAVYEGKGYLSGGLSETPGAAPGGSPETGQAPGLEARGWAF